MRKSILFVSTLVILTSFSDVKTNVSTEANNTYTYKDSNYYTVHLIEDIKERNMKIDKVISEGFIVEKSAEVKSVKINLSTEEDVSEYEIFNVSAYSNHVASTGKHKGDNGYGITKSGATTTEGITVSADTRLLPLGTRIHIEGIGERIVQDTGGAIKGKKLDLYFEDEGDALEFGRQHLRVKIISIPNEN